MIATIREIANRILGRGEATITVPSFDGALKPNQTLESATILLECEAPEDLATDGDSLLIADGARLLRLAGSSPTTVRTFERPISALATLPSGGLAVALSGTEVHVYDNIAAKTPASVFTGELHAVNSLAPASDGTLIATDGSSARGVGDWARDLMELGQTGRVFLLDPRTHTTRRLAGGFGYAFGAVASGSDVLDLRPLFSAAHYAGTNPIGDGYLRFDADGAGGTRVMFDPDGPATGNRWPFTIVTLDHVEPSGVHTGDWLFA